MKKIKFLIASMLGAIALVFACVLGTRVNAATISGGSYTGNSDLSSQSWDFTTVSASANSFSAGDTLVGGIIFHTAGSSGSKFKDGLLSMNGGTWYIPVMGNSTGSITITVTGSAATDRYFLINNDSSKKINTSTSGDSYDYGLNDIITFNEKTYLSLTAYKECKVGSISISSSAFNLGDFTGLSVSNSTTYYVDDTFSTDGLVVTGTFANGSRLLSTSEYSTSFSPELSNSKFTSTGDYTLTVSATIGGIQKSNTCVISVTTANIVTVTYYDASNTKKTKDIVSGEEFDVVLEKRGSKFLGWSETENGSVLTDLTITSAKTLYPIFQNMVAVTKGVEKDFISSSVSGSVTGTNDKFSTDMTLYSYTPGDKISFANNKISIGGSGSNSSEYVAFMIPGNSNVRVKMVLTLGGTNSTYVKVQCGDSIQIIDLGTVKATYEKQVIINNSSENSQMVYIYRTGGSNPTKASGVTINSLKVLADDRIATFGCQYDTSTPADATRIRFIATIEGISDVTKVDTVTFTIKANDNTKTFKCTQLYSSLSNKYPSLGASTGRYYAVYALTDIESAITSKTKIQELSVTVSFVEGSGLSSITATHNAFTVGTITVEA